MNRAAAPGPGDPGARASPWSGPRDDVFVKRRSEAPPGLFAAEAAGLRWLGEVDDGVDVVSPLEVAEDRIVLPRVPEVLPSGEHADEFGRRLARTHAAGAPSFGCGPPGWEGDGFIGPLVMPLRPAPAWGPWFAEQRLLPYLRAAHDAGAVTSAESEQVGRLLDLLVVSRELAGPEEPPARLHGDLWNGNVLWTAGGVVLIDPSAHGGHRETDLALLQLFDLPHSTRVLAAYDEAAPLADGWQERVGLHQLYPLLVHAVLFGGGYGPQAARTAARYL